MPIIYYGANEYDEEEPYKHDTLYGVCTMNGARDREDLIEAAKGPISRDANILKVERREVRGISVVLVFVPWRVEPRKIVAW